MPHRVDGEVSAVAAAVHQPQRHAGPRLPLAPVVLSQVTALDAVRRRALSDPFSRTIPTLLVRHIRAAEKCWPLLSGTAGSAGTASGLAFAGGLVANFRCPGNLRFQGQKNSRNKEAHSYSELWASLFPELISLSANLSCHTHLTAIQSETKDRNHCHWA